MYKLSFLTLNANDFSEYIYGIMFGRWDKNMVVSFGCYRTNRCNWEIGGYIINYNINYSAIHSFVIYFWKKV